MISSNKWPEFIEGAIPGGIGAAAAAVILWPVSYTAASHTAWLTTGTFLDFWLGAIAIVTGIAAIVGTVMGVIGLGIAGYVLAK